LPATLQVREISNDVSPEGFRVKRICIVTTVLDESIPAQNWAQLFRKRWTAELNLRDIKSTMQMEFLRAKTPEMVQKETGFFFLAYNIVRIIMEKASQARGVPLEKLSFKSTESAINIWSPNELLRVVGYPRLRNKKNRVEPRVRKRRPQNFQPLMGDRHEYKEIRHRNRYKKGSLS